MSHRNSQLTFLNRQRLQQLVERKISDGEIARQLRRRPTIYRELTRNTFHDIEVPGSAVLPARLRGNQWHLADRAQEPLHGEDQECEPRLAADHDKIIDAFFTPTRLCSEELHLRPRPPSFTASELSKTGPLPRVGSAIRIHHRRMALENGNKPIGRFMPGDTNSSAVTQQQVVAVAYHFERAVAQVPRLSHTRQGIHGAFARMRVVTYPSPAIAAFGLDSPNHSRKLLSRSRKAYVASTYSPAQTSQSIVL